MGMPKGSKRDPITGKWLKPGDEGFDELLGTIADQNGEEPAPEEGDAPTERPAKLKIGTRFRTTGVEKSAATIVHRTKKNRAGAQAKDPGGANKGRSFHKFARSERDSVETFIVFALIPGRPRTFIGYLEECSHVAVAEEFGGGEFEIQPWHRYESVPLGDPLRFVIDRNTYPPKLALFQAQKQGGPMYPQVPPYGQSSFVGGGAFSPWQMPVPPNDSKVSELEGELEDLEDEIAQLRARVAAAERERDESRNEIAKLREDQQRERYEASLKSLEERLLGKKDPLENLIMLQRAISEMGGSPIGAHRVQEDPLAQIDRTLALVEKLKERAGNDGGGGGGLAALTAIAPLIQKLMDQQQNKPMLLQAPPEQVPPPAPAPAPATAPVEGGSDVRKAALQLFEFLAKADAELAPFQAGTWIVNQDGPGWSEMRGIIRNDDPANFLPEIEKAYPNIAPPKAAWIVETLKSARERLQE
jgi:hypothetical protein